MIVLIVLSLPSCFITDHHFVQAHKSSRKYHSHRGLAGEPHRNSKEENWKWQKLYSSQKFSERRDVVSKNGKWRDNTKSSVVFQAGIGDLLLVMALNIFIGPESDHWQCLSLTDWLPNWLTDSVTFSRLELMALIRFSRLEKKLLYNSTAGRGSQTLKRRQMCDLKLACHRM